MTRILSTLAVAGALLTAQGGLAQEAGTAQGSGGGASRGGAVEEVIVTAQRTAESIQDVPIAVTALTGQMLEDAQIITPSDLQMNAPSVSFTPTNFGGSSISIRGIGRLVIASTGESGVSTHINEVPLSTNLNAIEFYDMERVEILRGPQGTLYGRNATGGAINLVTAMPDYEQLGGFVDAEVGDYNHFRVKAALNMPFGNRAGLRLAGFKLDRDGYIENLAHEAVGANGSTIPGIDDDIDGRDILSWRATFAFDLTDQTSGWVQYSRFEEDSDRARITNQVCKRNTLPTTGCVADEFGFDAPHLGATTGGIFGGLVGALPLGADGSDPSLFNYPAPQLDGFRQMFTDMDPVYQSEEDLVLVGFEHEASAFTVGLLGAWQQTEFFSRQDYLMDVGANLGSTPLNPAGLWPTSEPAGGAGDDWRPGPCNLNDGTTGVFGGCILDVDQTRVFSYDQADNSSEYWTVEGRIQTTFDGPFNFQVGASTYDTESNGDYYVLANTLDMVSLYGAPAIGFPPLYPGYFNNTGDPSGGTLQDGWAVFGEAYFDVNDRVKITAGLRYNEDNKEVKDTSVLFNAVNSQAVALGLSSALAQTQLMSPDIAIALDLLDPNYLANAPAWTRLDTLNMLLGPLMPSSTTEEALAREDALLRLYGATDEQLAAVAATPSFSAERVALVSMVPLVPQFGETRTLTGSPSTASWKEISGRVGIDWQVTDTSMIYGFFSRGYKPGGFNPAIPPAFQATSSFTFEAEEVNSIEIGVKNTLADGQLVLNGSAFLYDYGGLQVTRIANNTSLNDNVDANIMGVELEGMWRPEAAPGLQADFAYSWLNSEVDGTESQDPLNRTAGNSDYILLKNIDPGSLTGVTYIARESDINAGIVGAAIGAGATLPLPGTTYAPNADGVVIPAYFSREFLDAVGVETLDGLPVNLDGNALPNSPEHTLRLGLAYTFNVEALRGSLTARWDFYWQGESYAREFNTIGDEIDSWSQHNASLIYESNDGRWQLRAWVRNLANDDNVTGKYLTSDTSGFYRNYFLTEPRIYGASVRFNFSQ